MADDTSERECPHDDIGIRPRAGTIEMSEDRVPTRNIESPYGGGARSLPGATRNLLPVKFPIAPVLLADGPQLGSWQVAVMRVDEICMRDASGWECPVLNRIGLGRLTCLKLLEMFVQCCRLGVPPLVVLVNSVGPVGPCGMPSPYAEKIHEPLQHLVLIQADPAGRPSAVVMLSPSDCYPVGPAGPYVAGGPVGPDVLQTWNR